MKRHWRDEIKKVRDKLKELEKNRNRQVQRRHNLGLPTVSIIGYTNAGKTSLFNLLTEKGKLAKNVLFATLDSSVAKLYNPTNQKTILVSDTIGFIKNLPPELIDAFRSTLMESIHADLLLHVVDAADPQMEDKIKVVEKIIHDLGIGKKPIFYVFNKIDQLVDFGANELIEKYSQYSPFFVSVQSGAGIKELYYAIQDKLTLP